VNDPAATNVEIQMTNVEAIRVSSFIIHHSSLVVGAMLISLALCLPAVAEAAGPPGYEPGDVFVTRNADEAENTTPGHWNHVAVYCGEGLVVEAQEDRGGVVYSELAEFIARYPEIRLLRLRMGGGQAIADEVWRHVGTPYRKLASLPIRLRPTERGNNCVSILRRGYIAAVGRDPRYRLPDDAMADPSWQIMGAKP